MPKFSLERVQHVTDGFWRFLGGNVPDVVIVLGSGLSGVTGMVQNASTASYRSLRLEVPKAEGHEGVAYFGHVGEKSVLVLSGRVHCYEGVNIHTIVASLRALVRIGVKNFILTSAVGSLSRLYEPGKVVLVGNHISLFMERDDNPLMGRWLHESGLGPRLRFTSMEGAYHGKAFNFVSSGISGDVEFFPWLIAPRQGLTLAFARGPQYETAAEAELLAKLGAHVVGMSVVPEVMAIQHMALGISDVEQRPSVSALSFITNYSGAGSNSHEEVMDAGPLGAARLTEVLHRVITQL